MCAYQLVCILACDVGCLDYYSPTLARGDCILQGVGQKLTTTVRVQHWQRKYFKLYPNHLEWADNYVVSICGSLVYHKTQVFQKETKEI